MRYLISTLVLLLVTTGAFSQNKSHIDTADHKSIKRGWVFGGLPTIAFDSDLGLQYGALVTLHNYADGSNYPEYHDSFILEISRYTKGSGVNQFFYDSKYLLPKNIRITADVSYLTDKALNFYGFNGYDAVYFKKYEEKGSGLYISRMFYRQQRHLFRLLVDFQGKLWGNNLKWMAGIAFLDFEINTVDIEEINKGKKAGDLLPDVPLLYDKYNTWGIIPEDECRGGAGRFFRLGIILDTRDFEANPSQGIWSEAMIMSAPRFLWNKDFAYAKLSVIHRQYVPIIGGRLTLAYRIGYQTTLNGHAPFYVQPVIINSFSTTTKFDGLGGARTLRGILRNRVVGDGMVYGNFEMRWKMIQGFVWKQHIYLGLIGFVDAGRVTKNIEYSAFLPGKIQFSHYFDPGAEALHVGYGAGLRIGINENFIIAIDYGIAASERDGTQGLYIGINNIF